MNNGRPNPLGATPTEEGVNFSIFSAHAQAIYLLNKPYRTLLAHPRRRDFPWAGLCLPCRWPVRTRIGIPLRPHVGAAGFLWQETRGMLRVTLKLIVFPLEPPVNLHDVQENAQGFIITA
jgi:hypothetical protein